MPNPPFAPEIAAEPGVPADQRATARTRPASPARAHRAALLVVLAGVSAALHVGKLPPALPVLRGALGLTLVEAGFMLSLVQLAGMTLGLAVGLAADTFGLRRGMVFGLVVLGAASLLGGWARSPAALLALRALEGAGFLLAVTPAPSLIRRLVGAEADRMLGLWGAYMPIGTALALLGAPYVIDLAGWPGWWWLLGGLTLAMAAALRSALPADDAATPALTAPDHAGGPWPGLDRLRVLARLTLASPGPWALALCFGVYSGQWLAVLGFLPSIYAQGGVAARAAGVLTSLIAAANIVGNIAAGRLLQRGVPPPRLIRIGFVTMVGGAVVAYLPWFHAWVALRFAGLLLFSMLGGLIPGTLFALAVRLAPEPRAVSTTVGWMQQCSAFGQFAGPPVVAWIAHRAGGWQWTWVVTGAMAAAGLVISGWIATLLAARRAAAHV